MIKTFNERLIVRNFGPISNLNIQIRQLTLFIGTQGSGKSTVSKLLIICRDVRWWLQILNEDNVMKPFVDFGINEYFQNDSYIFYVHDGEEIKYEKGKFYYKSKGKDDIEAIKQSLNIFLEKSSISLLAKTGLTEDDLSDPHTLNLLKANCRLGLYILAERNLVGNLSDSLASIWK